MAETFVTVYQGNGGRVDIGYDYTQDITNNKTSLTVKAYVVKTNASYYSYRTAPQTFTLTVNGVASTYGWTFNFSNMTTGTRYLIMTAVREITHNADGTKSPVATSVYCTTETDGLGTISGSTNISIATIPRASVPTLSAGTQAIDSAITIYMNRASTAFTHTVTFAFGGVSGTIGTGVTDNVGWTLPSSLAGQIPNALSGNGTIWVDTYSGGTWIGQKAIVFTATVPDNASYQPSISGLASAISGTGRDYTVSKYVQNFSKAVLSFTSTANGGATIVGNSINIKRQSDNGNSMTINGTSGTSETITLSGVYIITATNTDSRGRSKTATTTITVEAYAVPTITTFTGVRNATTKTLVDTVRGGTYTYMGGSNTLSVVISRAPNGGAYTTLNTTAGTVSSTFTGNYQSTGNTETASYQFKLTVTDSFGNSATSVITVPTSSVALSIKGDVGIGVGKVWEQGALDVQGAFYKDGLPQGAVETTVAGGVNLNTLTKSGFYRLASGHPNSPSTNIDWSQLIVVHGGADTITQIGIGYSTNKMFIRSGAPTDVGGTGTWSAWAEVWTSNSFSPTGDANNTSLDLGIAKLLRWKNYGNGHVIIDASAGTSPTGTAINSSNSAVAWSATYPSLMGWNGTSTYGVRVDSARIADTILPPSVTFIPVTLLNGWVNYGGWGGNAGYYKDPFGFVHIRGLIKSGVIPRQLFTLPVGYRPQYDSSFQVYKDGGGTGQINIYANGYVEIASGSTVATYLDIVPFYAGA